MAGSAIDTGSATCSVPCGHCGAVLCQVGADSVTLCKNYLILENYYGLMLLEKGF